MYLINLNLVTVNSSYVLPLYQSESEFTATLVREKFRVLIKSGLRISDSSIAPQTTGDYVLIGPSAFTSLCNLYFPPLLKRSLFNDDGSLEVVSCSVDLLSVSEDCRLSYLPHLYRSLLNGEGDLPDDINMNFSKCIQLL